jgi:hypothetical protein
MVSMIEQHLRRLLRFGIPAAGPGLQLAIPCNIRYPDFLLRYSFLLSRFAVVLQWRAANCQFQARHFVRGTSWCAPPDKPWFLAGGIIIRYQSRQPGTKPMLPLDLHAALLTGTGVK